MSNIEVDEYILKDNPNISGKLINISEFYLIDNNNIINKILLIKREDGISIESNKYFISFNLTDISSIIKSNFKDINDIYNYIHNLFNEKLISIKNIVSYNEIQLKAKINMNKENKNIIFILKYNKDKKDFNYIELIKRNNILEEELSKLKEENIILKNKIIKMKEIYDNNKGPQNLKILSEITKDSYSDDVSDNTFTVFKSIHDYFLLIYSTKNKSIISYDLIKQQKIIEIKNSHADFITNFRHFFDKKNIRDIIMSISCSDRNIKLWNTDNWECILDLKNIYNEGFIYSSTFLDDNNNNYLITSNYNHYNTPGYIKVYDFKGKLIKEIISSNENTSYIDTYYDKNFSDNHYILTGNSNRVVVYIFETNILFKEYKDNYNNNHLSIIIYKSNDILKLIESCYDGKIRIWNFYTAQLLIKIQISNNWLYGICIWNESYLLVGCSDKAIKLIEINDGFIAKNMKGHFNSVLTIKKIKHPKYGDCILSQGYNEDQIKLWIINKSK
jgi:hypothetical protein